jgi:hypothetical protein
VRPACRKGREGGDPLFFLDLGGRPCGNDWHNVSRFPEELQMKKQRLTPGLYAMLLLLAALAASTLDAQLAPAAGDRSPKAAAGSPQTAAKPKAGTTGLGSPPAAKTVATAPAGPPNTAQLTTAESGQNSLVTVPLKITLTPSETPIKLGSTSNIAADIENISSRPLAIDTNTIQLMTHAILSETDTLCVLPLTPTTNTTMMGLQILQPQDHLTVLFNLSQRRMDYSPEEQSVIDGYFQTMAAPAGQQELGAMQAKYQKAMRATYLRSCDPKIFGPIERALDFTPGNYEYYLTGKFSVCDPATPNACPIPSRSFAQSNTFQVGIDQTQIIIFAIVGGLLAYLVVSVRGDKGSLNHFFTLVNTGSGFGGLAKAASKEGVVLIFKVMRDLIGVAILSAAFTIVTSRLSDSQFPIKVSVLDGWGAMTIGFLSYFAGNKFIDSLRGMVK